MKPSKVYLAVLLTSVHLLLNLKAWVLWIKIIRKGAIFHKNRVNQGDKQRFSWNQATQKYKYREKRDKINARSNTSRKNSHMFFCLFYLPGKSIELVSGEGGRSPTTSLPSPWRENTTASYSTGSGKAILPLIPPQSLPPIDKIAQFRAKSNTRIKGDVAHMVERSLCMREVRGSIPRISNIS